MPVRRPAAMPSSTRGRFPGISYGFSMGLGFKGLRSPYGFRAFLFRILSV